jgi:GTP-binding protein
MLKQAGTFRANEQVEERVMDSNDLERERGITIFSKNAAISYGGYKVNIVDTPGHADFGGEVQRILKMVDSVLLLVDAFEGAMPQTKYVLKKALEHGLRPIVVINKIDRPNARPEEVLDMVFDLFVELNANDMQLDFPVIYASARDGYAMKELGDPADNLIPLFDSIIENVDDPEGSVDEPFQFLVTNIAYDNYVGKTATGKIHNGSVKLGEEVVLLKRDGERLLYRVSKIIGYEGLKTQDLKEAFCGDIVTLAGLEMVDVGETIACRENPLPLPLIDIDEPTLAMTFMVNNSPFAGRDGKFVTSRQVRDRLFKELQSNVSMRVEETGSADSFIVKGRGELQLSILIENMRREGYEIQVSKPSVIMKDIEGHRSEPIELAIVDVADEYVGVVIEKLGVRKGEMVNMTQGSDGYTRLEFKVPARGLIGFRNEFLTDTKGTGVLNHSFYEYEFYKGPIPSRTRGVLVAIEDGVTVAYGLHNLKDRGTMFLPAGVDVYEGMIVGEHTRENDLVVNPCKGKKLTNMRSSGSDESTKMQPPRLFSLEQALEYIADDELLEITPENIRMRKKVLNANLRKRNRSEY